ncbi:MAG TPA: 50S ribosomal protein L29 [Nitrospiria bacterium]|jgi:large subunit ribosomal protein L29
MEMKELKDLSQEELLVKEQGLKKELFNLKFQLTAGRIESTARIRQVRRDIARVKTTWRIRDVMKPSESEGEK